MQTQWMSDCRLTLYFLEPLFYSSLPPLPPSPSSPSLFLSTLLQTYLGPDSNLTDCQYHPGVPIFHEGSVTLTHLSYLPPPPSPPSSYKLWSCCQRRTSDFNEFLRQEGCKAGNHEWKVRHLYSPNQCSECTHLSLPLSS